MDVRNPSPQAVLATTVNLTAAQIAALGIAPITLIPAPGANRAIVVLGVVFAYKFGTVPYSQSGGASPVLKYATTGDLIFNGTPAGFMTNAASEFYYTAVTQTLAFAAAPGDDNKAVQLTTGGTFAAGPIATATLGAAGLGYAPNDTGTINDGSDDATYKILTVGAGGAVLTFQVTGAGTDYTIENGVATATGGAQPGVGVGFTVNVTAVTAGDGTLKVTTFYSVLPVL